VPIRVLYISAAGMLGGAEHSLLELLRVLDRRRVEPVAAVPAGQPLAEELKGCGVEVFFVPPFRPRRTPSPARLGLVCSCWTAAVRAVAREARRHQVDLIHSNTTAAHLVGAPAAAVAHVPAVWHVRDFLVLPFLGRLMTRGTRGAIFVSEAVGRAVKLDGGADVMARVIPNGIDADAFAKAARPGAFRAELGMGAGEPLLLMAAQMVPWKGHELFIRAVKLLREWRADLVAVVAGADLFGEHAGYGASLRRLVSELGVAGTVRFVGYRTDMATLMADCDVVVIPSEAEPFGRVALEAMALGRPVVGTAAGGLGEVVAPGETGLLVPGRNPADLAGAVRRILSDAPLRCVLAANAAQRVRSQFAASAHARRVTQLYEEILAAMRGR